VESVVQSLRDTTIRLLKAAVGLLPELIAALVLLAMFWAIARLVRRLLRSARRSAGSPPAARLFVDVVFYLILGFGAIVALEVVGVNVQTMATGVGLGGVALGFALKDIASNAVSGFLLASSHEFSVGDQIVVGDTEGTVERIELRATHIRTYDGRLVVVPNGQIYTSRVTNNTQSSIRRGSVPIYIAYEQDHELAMEVALHALERVDGVVLSPAPYMRLTNLTPELVQLEARFWADSRRADFMKTASSVRRAVLSALKSHGVALPDPNRRHVSLQSALVAPLPGDTADGEIRTPERSPSGMQSGVT
jgi:small-conductance mechanosensitive channel